MQGQQTSVLMYQTYSSVGVQPDIAPNTIPLPHRLTHTRVVYELKPHGHRSASQCAAQSFERLLYTSINESE